MKLKPDRSIISLSVITIFLFLLSCSFIGKMVINPHPYNFREDIVNTPHKKEQFLKIVSKHKLFEDYYVGIKMARIEVDYIGLCGFRPGTSSHDRASVKYFINYKDSLVFIDYKDTLRWNIEIIKFVTTNSEQLSKKNKKYLLSRLQFRANQD